MKRQKKCIINAKQVCGYVCFRCVYVYVCARVSWYVHTCVRMCEYFVMCEREAFGQTVPNPLIQS